MSISMKQKYNTWEIEITFCMYMDMILNNKKLFPSKNKDF